MNEYNDLIVGQKEESILPSDGTQSVVLGESASVQAHGQVQPSPAPAGRSSAAVVIAASMSMIIAKRAQAQTSGLSATPPVVEFYGQSSINVSVESTTAFSIGDELISISGANASWFTFGVTALEVGTTPSYISLNVNYLNTTSVNCTASLDITIGGSTLSVPLYGQSATTGSPGNSASSGSSSPGDSSSSSSSASDSSNPNCSCCSDDIPC